MAGNFWSRFSRYRMLGALSLGPLEKGVMERMWKRKECTVRDIFDDYAGELAYTTLMTTVDRLHKKGLLNRSKDGKAFVYSTKFSREELDRRMVRELLGALVKDSGPKPLPVLSCFVDAISEEDDKLLSALEEEIKRRRAAQKKAGA
jgi:predicted transcriptional regulator